MSRGLNLAGAREEHASTRGINETVVLGAVSHTSHKLLQTPAIPDIYDTTTPSVTSKKSLDAVIPQGFTRQPRDA